MPDAALYLLETTGISAKVLRKKINEQGGQAKVAAMKVCHDSRLGTCRIVPTHQRV